MEERIKVAVVEDEPTAPRRCAQSLTNAAIAERLVLAEKSVENQLTAIYGELGIDRRAEAVHPRVRAVLV